MADKKINAASTANSKLSLKGKAVQISDPDAPEQVPVEESRASNKRDFEVLNDNVQECGQSCTGLTEEQQADLFFTEQSKRRVPLAVANVPANVGAQKKAWPHLSFSCSIHSLLV
jgi:hypothetical protein